MPLNFHLMHPGGPSLPGDPNAAFYLDGIYHLHYILAHPWQGQESFAFVHVTSPDMLHWTQSGELMIMVILGGAGTLASRPISTTVARRCRRMVLRPGCPCASPRLRPRGRCWSGCSSRPTC